MSTDVYYRQTHADTATLIHLFRRATHTNHFSAGATIFRQGEPGHVLYVVTLGEVDIIRDGVCIATYGVGELIGEMAVLDQQPRSATAVARTACTLALIDQHTFQFMIENTPYFAVQVMHILSTRLREMATRALASATQPLLAIDMAELLDPQPTD